MSFEVRKLVLHDTCEESVCPFVVFLEIFVKIFYVHLFGAYHFLVYSGNTQTAFVNGACFFASLYDTGVDIGFAEIFVFGIVVGKIAQVYYHKAYGQTYLGSGESHTLGVFEGFIHVGYELLQLGIFGGYVFCHLAQNGFAIYINKFIAEERVL